MWIVWGNTSTAELWIYEPGKTFPDDGEVYKFINIFENQQEALDFRAEIERIHNIGESAKRALNKFKEEIKWN